MPKHDEHHGEFEQRLAPHLRELLGTATRLAGSKAGGEDLLQESALRAWRYWERFEEGTNRRAWMHRIVFNTFVNQYRKHVRERDLLSAVYLDAMGSANAESAGEGSTTLDAMADEVHHALSALPVEFREVIVRVDIEMQSYKEVAEALACPVGTVMSRLHRARRALRSTLRGYAAERGFGSMPNAA
jgi:RNA polymerase sigma-70 factor (ECF subfamily)